MAKKWLSRIAGIALSCALFWYMYAKVSEQLSKSGGEFWHHTGPVFYLWVAGGLMLVNIGLESYKWRFLLNKVDDCSYRLALTSYLAGLAISTLTPGSIGDYPGRVVFLQKGNWQRYAHVAITGALAHLMVVYLFGLCSLAAFLAMTGTKSWFILILAALFCGGIYLLFVNIERILEWCRRFQFVSGFIEKAGLIRQISGMDRWVVVFISAVRFMVYASQLIMIMYWMDVNIALPVMICLVILFYWAMTAVPTMALGELGVRGGVALYLFGLYSQNSIGIAASTMVIWLLNIIFPAIVGACLIAVRRMGR